MADAYVAPVPATGKVYWLTTNYPDWFVLAQYSVSEDGKPYIPPVVLCSAFYQPVGLTVAPALPAEIAAIQEVVSRQKTMIFQSQIPIQLIGANLRVTGTITVS